MTGRSRRLTMFDQVVRVIHRDTADTTLVNSVTKTAMFTYTVPANLLGINRSIRVTIGGTSLQNTGSNKTITAFVDFGGTTMWQDAWSTYATNASRYGWNAQFHLLNDGTASAQVVSGMVSIHAAGTSGRGNLGSGGDWVQGFDGTAAIDTTADRTLNFQIQLGTADANYDFIRNFTIVELLP